MLTYTGREAAIVPSLYRAARNCAKLFSGLLAKNRVVEKARQNAHRQRGREHDAERDRGTAEVAKRRDRHFHLPFVRVGIDRSYEGVAAAGTVSWSL